MSCTQSFTTCGRLVGLRRLSCRVCPIVYVLERGRGTTATDRTHSPGPDVRPSSERLGYRNATRRQDAFHHLALRRLTTTPKPRHPQKPPAEPPHPPHAPPYRVTVSNPQPPTPLTTAEAAQILAENFAPWIQALNLKVEKATPTSTTVRLPWQHALAREGGTLC